MLILSLVLSIIALIVAIVAIVLLQVLPRGGVQQGGTYTITGNIRVTNDCDGRHASIRNQVTVQTALASRTSAIQIPAHATINLVPDPADPNNPIKIGTYTITAQWIRGVQTLLYWKAPQVLTSPNFGSPICNFIVCPDNNFCRDTVTPSDIQITGPTTNHDIVVVCACSQTP